MTLPERTYLKGPGDHADEDDDDGGDDEDDRQEGDADHDVAVGRLNLLHDRLLDRLPDQE